MSEALHTETVTHGKRMYTINVHHDSDVPSPLDTDYNDTNKGVHITHNKGSRDAYGNTPLDEEDHIRIGRRIGLYGNKAAALAEALREKDEDEEALDDEPLIGLPVSGQSGFIYITEKTALEWQGGKRMGKRKLERVLKSLEAVVEEYSQWCNGECYYYTVTDDVGDDVHDLGCGGFIGMDWLLEDAKSNIKAYHENTVKAERKEKIERRSWEARGVITAPK